MQTKPFFLIPLLLFIGLFTTSGELPPANNSENEFIVVLDAGHGGHDPGNLGNGYLEKNIALNIVLQVGKLLEKEKDIKVIYTRKDDSFVDLYVRGEIANKANADLFVSVHCDSHSSDAHGAGTFVLGLHANKQNFEIAKKENSVIYLEDNYQTRYAEYDINSPESVIGLTIMQEEFLDQSILLAKMMQENFSKGLKRNDRKVKQAGFIVLHQTFMPSVLIETGFLTNKNEGVYLNSKKGQGEMGKAIADAIKKYKENVRGGVPSTTNVPEAVVSSIPKKEDSEDAIPDIEEEQVEEPKATTGKEESDVKSAEESIPGTEISNEKVVDPPKEEEIAAVEKEMNTAKTVDKEVPETIAESPTAVVSGDKKNKGNEEKPTSEASDTSGKPEAEVVPEMEEKATANIIFKVQLLASSKNIALKAENFKGLNKLSREPYKNLFRYLYGNTNSYLEAKLLKSNANGKGYDTAYIVAYKNGERIPMPEALKYVKQ